jgi:hypothetical protein
VQQEQSLPLTSVLQRPDNLRDTAQPSVTAFYRLLRRLARRYESHPDVVALCEKWRRTIEAVEVEARTPRSA